MRQTVLNFQLTDSYWLRVSVLLPEIVFVNAGIGAVSSVGGMILQTLQKAIGIKGHGNTRRADLFL